eukprot:g13679.t1
MALTALVVKLDKFAEAARKEEALRALVPAGSERRDLDLQVAEAVRLTSKVAQEVEEARLRREEAAIALEKARWGTAATMSSNGDDQILEVPAAAESLTRPKTVPTLSSSRSTSNQTKQEDEAMAGTGTAVKAAEDGGRGGVEEASRSESTEAENLRRLSEEYAKAKRDFVDALARRESAPVRRALALIRDHGDILRLKEKDTPEDADLNNILVQGRARRKRRPRGETPLLGVQLNAQIALGAKIALLRGSGEEDEEGNVILPEIDDRFLTVGQRLRRLRDARDGVEREKKRAYLEYSRQVKRNLRARKRFVLAEKRAGRIAQTMNTKQLVEALQERGYSTEGSETLDQLRRLFVDGIKPEMRVRLHATSRWTKSRNKHRERSNDAQVGDIAARRQRIRLPTGIAHPAFDNDKRGVGQDIRHAATV